MFEKLAEAIFGWGDGTSWLDLDTKMKGSLRVWGTVCVLALLAIALITLYAYIKWPPLREAVDPVVATMAAATQGKESFPLWLGTLATVGFSALVILTMGLMFILIDFGKLHYRLDSVTCRLQPTVRRSILSHVLTHLECPGGPGCALRKRLSEPGAEGQFLNDVFYYFANQDSVGSYNQKDKRRQAFGFWNKYYVFNFFLVVVTLSLAWFVLLAAIVDKSKIGAAIVSALLLLEISFWIWRGRRYRRDARQLAVDQIREFIAHDRTAVHGRVRLFAGPCLALQCPL